MKKWLILLLALALGSCAAASAETVVTSFYPIYVFALNLTAGTDVTVQNMTDPGTGCLHDYQLQTSDMKLLAQADALLINGAGMEGFLTDIAANIPDLPVVDASAGIELLLAEEDGHEHTEDDGHEHHYNAHIWLDAENAIQMVRNLADGLMQSLPAQAEAIAANRDAYILRLEALDAELTAALATLPHRNIITFHEAFPYLAKGYGLEVAAVITRDPDESLSPRALAELVKLVRKSGNPPLFIEPQYEDAAAKIISAETGAPLFTLDPMATGPAQNIPLTLYEDVMRSNLAVLLTALGE